MEKKLEFKQIAPYLPYGLKFKRNVRITDEDKEEIKTMKGCYEDTTVWVFDIWEERKFNAVYIKPILRPLSDFEKITCLILMDRFNCSMEIIHEIWSLIQKNISLEDISLKTYLMMCKNHIDFNCLIEKGLALDINKLND